MATALVLWEGILDSVTKLHREEICNANDSLLMINHHLLTVIDSPFVNL